MRSSAIKHLNGARRAALHDSSHHGVQVAEKLDAMDDEQQKQSSAVHALDDALHTAISIGDVVPNQ